MLLLPRDQEKVLVFVDALCSPSCSISFYFICDGEFALLLADLRPKGSQKQPIGFATQNRHVDHLGRYVGFSLAFHSIR